MKRMFAGFAAALGLLAQTPPKTIENTGRPMTVTAECKLADMPPLGLSCSEDEPCPLYLELSDLELVGTKLFVVGNLHTNSATLESIVLASEDLGKTWFEPTPRILGSGLDHIEFVDFENGWISGQLQQALPRDAFFLLSDDGGKTWRKRTVSGESQIGAIEQFHFENKTNGMMILDLIQPGENGNLYELYESNTGGESWSVRQLSPKPIPWKYPKHLSGEFRLHPDGPSKSFRLERKQAEKWVPVASFLISAGLCKPAEPADVAPPAEPKADEPPTGVFVIQQGTPSKKKPHNQ
jgi:hypothetical protein